ncbi:MAG: imidazoleglycerol-phosphate dehydratase HisB [Lachnospiraceae bacterium]|nr:imidazoleglycerol-phosphate dehydratase HisB [Lachnospiraceae bacterium]
MSERSASIDRKTKETDISLTIDLDGSGETDIETGIGFFDHMLCSFAKHGQFDLALSCKGDLIVDCHHTIEDCGIVLGQAINKALGDKKGISRYGECLLPMDESLVLSAVDLCGRPYLVFDEKLPVERVGYMDTEMVKEFFYAVSYSAMMNIHIKLMHGENAHHIIEATFKSFARSLNMATKLDPGLTGVLSTKGSLG